VQIDMFLYALALLLEFAALVWLRLKEPEMHRPYRVPFGTAGVIAFSVPPVVLCVVSMVLANTPTKLVGLGGMGIGLIVYRAIAVRRKRGK